jgi:acyl-CoA synthetase (AMP-forming)/AMP-acid ligase II
LIAENLVDLVRMNALRLPEKVALVDGARRITYAGLYEMVLAVAAALQEHGVRRGRIVGVVMPDTVDHVVTMLAVLRLGAVLLPMDVRWTEAERANVVLAFDADAVVLQDEATVAKGVAAIRFEPAMLSGSSRPILPSDFNADEPLLLSLSSGTTGIPKGPLLTHRQMMLRNQAEWISLGYLQDDVFLCATPLYFGGGRGFTLSYLTAGGTVVLAPPPLKLPDLAAMIRQEGVTTTFLVPTQLRRLLPEPAAVQAPFRGLRLVVSSGSVLHAAEREAVRLAVNARILNLYASTEGGAVSVLYPGEVGSGSVGRSVLGSAFGIATESGEALAPGHTGLIRHRAAWTPAAFHRNPQETARWFRDGWYYTGDVGHVDAAGFLHITGRAKDMIIRGGINIYPDEIEAALIAHPAVADAAVVGRAASDIGEQVVAFVVLAAELDETALRTHCQERLAPYKVPSAFVRVAELPRNPGGKVEKAILRQQFEGGIAPC